MEESKTADPKSPEKCDIALVERQKTNVENVNNNSVFHANENSGKAYSFPKKARIDIQFDDVRYKIREWTVKKPIPVKKEILKGVNGEFLAGELTAIMGPSGAGKSTLLNVLAAFTLRGSSGSVRINGRERNSKDPEEFKKLSCYIQQDDYIRMELTVGEAMTYTTDLKLGNSFSQKKKKEQIQGLLEMLGLSHCWDTQSSRLSGGQRKRLSIALELISNPPIIFLDEPTTGLDSSSCSQCVSLLKFLAQQGRTVICTIHQPSALIFEMFDKLYALADGQCIYSGRVKDLVPYLAGMDLFCPQYHNPADFLLDVAIGEYEANVASLAAAEASRYAERKQNMEKQTVLDPNEAEAALLSGMNNNEYKEANDDNNDVANVKIKPASLVTQFWLLYCRKLLMIRRKPSNILVRILAHVSIALLFGYLYQDVGRKASTVLANYCYIYGTILFLVYTGKMSVTLMFPIEMWSVTREHFNRWYKLGPYYMSLMLVELPFQILCCYLYIPISYYLTSQPLEWYRFWMFSGIATVSSLTAQSFGFLLGVTTPKKIAVFIGPVLACLFSVFGFCLRYTDTPDMFRWLYWISYFRAGFQTAVLSVYGFGRGVLYCGEDEFYCHFKHPKKFLTEMDMPTIDIDFNFVYIFSWGLVLHIITIIFIWFKLNKK